MLNKQAIWQVNNIPDHKHFEAAHINLPYINQACPILTKFIAFTRCYIINIMSMEPDIIKPSCHFVNLRNDFEINNSTNSFTTNFNRHMSIICKTKKIPAAGTAGSISIDY
jgi:hypothetical protein